MRNYYQHIPHKRRSSPKERRKAFWQVLLGSFLLMSGSLGFLYGYTQSQPSSTYIGLGAASAGIMLIFPMFRNH